MSDGPQYGPDNPHPLSRLKTELVWEGKYDEYGNRREVDLVGADLPLQKIESIDEPYQAAQGTGQLKLYEERNKRQDDFRNMLLWGDNKLVMASLLRDFRGKIDLIYIDPPFDVGTDFSFTVPVGESRDTLRKDQSILEAVAYRDTWGKGTDSYLHMIYERLMLARDLLAAEGCIYVHVGPNVSFLVRALLGELFGPTLSGAITWQRTSSHGDSKWWGVVNDDILFFTKGMTYKWNPQYRGFSDKYIESHYSMVEEGTGRRFSASSLTAAGTRNGETGQPWRGFDPNTIGRHWSKLPSALDQLDRDGRIYWPKKEGGWPREKLYLEERPGRAVQNVWDDIPPVNSQAQEDTAYDTQKPEALLERIIQASSNEGDLVGDFFCGSGTTGSVAEKLGRRWIMADLGRFAIHTSRKRMIEVQRKLYQDGKPYRAFDVYNLGRYERQWWQKERLAGADEEHREIVLAFYRAEPLTGASSPLLHGRKGPALVMVDGIDSILTLEELRAAVEAAGAMGAKEIHCLAWEFEMDLKRNAEALEHEFGVKARLIRIPREVMEKNRRPGVDEVPFFEMATLAAEAVVRVEGGVRMADVKLANFLPSLSEVPNKELEALRERAVRSGFDFIDFWAVDFDHHEGKPFQHHWQDYRLRKDRTLKTASDCGHKYEDTAAHTICVKVIDVFGCDTSILLEVAGAGGLKSQNVTSRRRGGR